MDRDGDRIRTIARRTLILGGLQVGAFGALAARMYYLQITEQARYARLAEENRINMRLLPPRRGLITDRYGQRLSVNNQNFRLLLVPEQVDDVELTLARINPMVQLTPSDMERVTRDISRRRSFVPVAVKDQLTWEQVSWIEVNGPELPGLSIDVGDQRHYPFGPTGVHVVGYVGAVSEDEIDGDPVLSLPGFKIGKTGVEKRHEERLRGVAGTSQVEVNAVGRVIRELDRDEGRPGEDAQLTLDIGLQAFVADRLKEEHSAACAVMDIHTGEVYALVSHPGYDPNLFTSGISATDWHELITNEYGPLNNKAISGTYAPGSTFKMLVALAGLEDGSVPRDHEVYCPGHMTLGNHRFHCWRRGGHGSVDLVQAIAQSCDTYFYDISLRIGIDKIQAMAHRLGIGELVGIDIPGERPGLVPSHAWKRANLGTSWQRGETLVASIGQGYVLATPLQLAVMTARMVNGGRAVRPRLTQQLGDDVMVQHAQPPLIGIADEHLDLIKVGMREVMDGARGTARRSQITEDGMAMAGKTGTSQVRRITMAERATGIIPNAERPWRDRDHALFVGFAPLHAPRYAVSVVVEHGGGGSSVAAPIAHDVMLETQRRAPGTPLGRPGPIPFSGTPSGSTDPAAG